MDLESILKSGAEIFQGKLDTDGDGKLELSDLTDALSNLVTDLEGKLDIASIASKMESGGILATLQSWLGNGENDSISPEQLTEMFGVDKISEFAHSVGISFDEAVAGLQESIPAIIDKASSNGSILDDIKSTASELMNMASNLFGR